MFFNAIRPYIVVTNDPQLPPRRRFAKTRGSLSDSVHGQRIVHAAHKQDGAGAFFPNQE